jgi:16S rRNA processing protein RimM
MRVQPFSADPQALFSSRRWHLQPGSSAQAAVRAVAPPVMLHITQARAQGQGVVATAQEVADRDAAEALKGARVFIARSSFPMPQPNEFYWVDLIGLDVVNREGVRLGRIADLIDTGGHCVLRVQVEASAPNGAAPHEHLIPFVAAYVDDVDIGQRRVSVDWGSDY